MYGSHTNVCHVFEHVIHVSSFLISLSVAVVDVISSEAHVKSKFVL